jgi:NTP pyrophosphatase (non-canonical NTP hydrolase)
VVEPSRQGPGAHLTTVLCGSFRRDRAALEEDRAALLDLGCEVLSPVDLAFVDEIDGFVIAEHERELAPKKIEASHLGSMEGADFIWLHAPEGYVGHSAAMELGFASALGLPVFAREVPAEVAFGGLVQVVRSPGDAVEATLAAAGDAPTRSLAVLQRYYARMAELRGWGAETARETLELLEGEVEELAQALRGVDEASRAPWLDVDQAGGAAAQVEQAALELADVQLYLIHLASALNIDLAAAVAAKERINERRFGQRAAA